MIFRTTAHLVLPVFFARAENFRQSRAPRIQYCTLLLVRYLALSNAHLDFMLQTLWSKGAYNALRAKCPFPTRLISALIVVRLVGSTTQNLPNSVFFVLLDFSILLNMPRRARHVLPDRSACRVQHSIKNVIQEHTLSQIHHHARGALLDRTVHPVKLLPLLVLQEHIV
jgi:hypothetical protein